MLNIKGVCILSTCDEHGPIYVYQTRTSRMLSFDRKVEQGCMKLNEINGLAHSYTQAMMSGLLFIPEVRTASIMGLGAGSMAKNLLHSFSELEVHAIEYRTEVVNVAVKYFYLPDDERLTIHSDDAVAYMKCNRIKSDIIFSDLFNMDGMEPKQVHSSYLRDCKKALNDHGVLVLNIWQEAAKLPEVLIEKVSAEFNNRLLRFDVETGNIIILAFKNDFPVMKRKEFLARAKFLQDKMNIPLVRHAKLLWSRQHYKFKTECFK